MKNSDIVEVIPSERLLPEELSAIVGGNTKIKVVGCNGHSCSCGNSTPADSTSVKH